jgi:hypothetical protein
MKRRLIITENQLIRLKAKLVESASVPIVVEKIKNELNRNYTPITKYIRKGGEYFEQPMIMIKADEEAITGKQAMDWLKSKLNYDSGKDAIIKQTIIDWVDGKIGDDNSLSKNIAIT